MSDNQVTAKRVEDALRAVTTWKTECESSWASERQQVEHEIDSLTQAVDNLTKQIEALGIVKAEVTAKSESLGDQVIARSYAAIFEVLNQQSQAILDRSGKVAEAETARSGALEAAAQDPAVAPLIQEYKQYQNQVEPTLSSLPESYRDVLVKHNEQILGQLRSHLGHALTGPIQLDASEIAVDVVYSVDSPADESGLVMLVLPVAGSVRAQWGQPNQALHVWLAVRALEGLYIALKSEGKDSAMAMLGGHQGQLVVEVEVDLSAPQLFAQKLHDALASAFANAPELTAARVTASPQFVDLDYLLPPEEDGDR